MSFSISYPLSSVSPSLARCSRMHIENCVPGQMSLIENRKILSSWDGGLASTSGVLRLTGKGAVCHQRQIENAFTN